MKYKEWNEEEKKASIYVFSIEILSQNDHQWNMLL